MQRRRRAPRFAVALLAVALVAGLAAVGGGQRTTGPYRVLQLNFCGNQRNAECGVDGRVGEAVEELVDLLVRTTPDVVMLQEICRSQSDAVVARAAARGLTLHQVFTTVWTDPALLPCPGLEQGDVLLSRRPVTDVVATCLLFCDVDTAVGEHRVLTCGTTTLGAAEQARVCVTHFENTRLEQQVATVADVVAVPARRMPVVLAGDLNTAQYARVLDGFYAAGSATSRGIFAEADACRTRREHTATCNVSTLDVPGADVKLDDVFVTAADVARLDAVTVTMPHSDHDGVLATLVLRRRSRAGSG
jgi:endonuclease/exonuclease/phosphatase family metal-dependent hydrolase